MRESWELLTAGPPDADRSVLLLPGGALSLTERVAATTFVDRGSAGSLDVGAWTDIAVEVVAAPGGRIRVSVGERTTVDVALETAAAAGPPAIQFGLSNAEAGGPWTVRFDDVRVDQD